MTVTLFSYVRPKDIITINDNGRDPTAPDGTAPDPAMQFLLRVRAYPLKE